jgi:hypothetical protein
VTADEWVSSGNRGRSGRLQHGRELLLGVRQLGPVGAALGIVELGSETVGGRDSLLAPSLGF